MGYLSQKKHHERINMLLNVSLGIISITTLLAMIDNTTGFSAFVNRWQFQIYVYLLIVFACALVNKFFLQTFFAFLLIVVNYTLIASSANLFNSSHSDGLGRLTILYQNNTQAGAELMHQAVDNNVDIIALNRAKTQNFAIETKPQYHLYNEDQEQGSSFIISKFTPLRSGKLKLSERFIGSYMTILAETQPLVFVNIDFSGITSKEEKNVYRNLGKFVVMQDNPVIIVGNFGIPAWSKTFQKFLNKTELEVKNRIILSDGSLWFNPLSVPSLNVLAYKKFGVKDVSFLPKDKNGMHPLLIELSF